MTARTNPYNDYSTVLKARKLVQEANNIPTPKTKYKHFIVIQCSILIEVPIWIEFIRVFILFRIMRYCPASRKMIQRI